MNKFLSPLKTRFERERLAARELQTIGSELTRSAKVAIFELQRGRAGNLLRDAEAILAKGMTIIKKFPGLQHEGMWHAGLEEYAEASLFQAFVEQDSKRFAKTIALDADIVIGAFSDLVGEMVRLAIREATNGNRKQVDAILKDAEEIVGFLTSINLTGGLRSKGDQARGHLRKLEDIRYELSLRS
jgi:predicted translin family RNA/ssDNA-binding protein